MKTISWHTNATCIDCDKIQPDMCRVGAFIMCEECVKLIFPTGQYDSSSAAYRSRLEKYMKEVTVSE